MPNVTYTVAGPTNHFKTEKNNYLLLQIRFTDNMTL